MSFSNETDELRHKFVCLIDNLIQNNSLSKKIEQSIYNYSIQTSKEKNIKRNWKNPFFKNLYISKVRSIYSNLKSDSYIQNNQLLENIKQDNIKPNKIGNLSVYEIYPDNWTELLNIKSKRDKNVYKLNKTFYNRANNKSFDYAILERTKKINAIKLNIPWSDLGSWKEICKMFNRRKKGYIIKKNIFYRPWGKYINLFHGKGFLMKELYVKPKGLLSLQKHYHRSEHWYVTQGIAKVTLDSKVFLKKINETVFIPLGSIHRIQNSHRKPLKIIEAQVGSILKETDIVRFEDIYGRVK